MKLCRNAFLLSSVASVICLSNVVRAQTSAATFTTWHRYDALGHETGTIQASANGTSGPFLAVRNTFDAAGLLIKVENGSLSSWQADSIAPANWSNFTISKSVAIAYDAEDRKILEAEVSVSGTVQSVTQYSYGALGRLECTVLRMNSSLYPAVSGYGAFSGGSLPSSACSLGAEGSVGPDRITKNVYDAAGQLVQVRRGVGTSLEQAYVTYAYSANGKQTDVIDANGNRATYTYDGFDRLVQWNFPSTSAPASFNGATQATALSSAGSANSGDYEAYAYDANSNRTSLRKRDGSVLGYTYDALNRVTVKAVPSRSGLGSTHTRSVYYSYDLQGHQLAAQFDGIGGEGVTSTFDGFGRQLTSSITMDGATRTVSYQYDANGNRTRVTHPDGVYVQYGYDGLDRMANGSWWAPASGTVPFLSISYDSAGRRSSITRASSYTNYGYDGISRLNTLAQQFANGDGNESEGFSYNPASQITSFSKSNNSYIFNGLYNVNRNYSVNGLNQYTAAGSASFAYDANGNLTSDGTTTFLYDIENRLVNAGGAKNAQLRYDPLGRLYEISGPTGTTRFAYDGDALIGEFDASGNLLRRYMWGSNPDEPILWDEGSAMNCSGTKVLHHDHQGSIVATANCWGGLNTINTYDEYGIPGSNNTGRFQYTGQAWTAELGMYYYKARFYSPTLGRFLQTDPIGYKDQVNLYAYVGNDPVNGKDPTGLRNCPANDTSCVETPESAQNPSDPTPPTSEQAKMAEIVVTAQRTKKTTVGDNIPTGSDRESFYVVTPDEIVVRRMRTTNVDCGGGVSVDVGRPGSLGAGQAAAHTHGPNHDSTPGPGDNIAARGSSTGAAFVMTSRNAFMVRSFSNGTYATNVLSGPPLTASQTSALQSYMQGWEGPTINNGSLTDRQRFCPK